MIRMTRVSDGAPANAANDTEAEMLQLQGYRRMDPRPPQFVEPTQPEATQPEGAQSPLDAVEQPAAEQPVQAAEVNQGAEAHPADTDQSARRRRPS